MRPIRKGDVLALPGVFATKDSSIERLLARPDVQRVVSLLPRAAAKGALIAASCSATFFVAAAGLLGGGSATTTWWLMPFFARRFPAVDLRADRMVVDSGTVRTAGSAFAHADLMLAVLARVTSPSLANLAATRVGYADAAAFRRIFRRHTGESPRGRRRPNGATSRESAGHRRP